jgi:hypothetical protein
MARCVICQEEFSEKRAALGYRTCLEHAERPKEFTVAIAFNKGAYQLITPNNIKDIGK